MNGLINTHKHVNNILDRELGNTHEWRSKCIDIVATTCGLVEYIKGC